MVLSPVLCSTLVPNPCLLHAQLVEALFFCSNQVLKGSADDCRGQLSISFCGAVSVNSHQKMVRSPLIGRGVFTRSQAEETYEHGWTSMQFVNDSVGAIVFSLEDGLVPVPNPVMPKVHFMESDVDLVRC